MGAKRKQYKEKEKLVEFLYKDSPLIESLYSQLFQGTLSQVQRREETSEKKSKDFGVSLKVAEGGLGSGKDVLTGSSETINPLDYKIKQLVNEIEPIEPTESMSDGWVVKVSGKIEFFHKRLLEENIPWLEQAGMLNGLYDNKIPLEGTELGAKEVFNVCRNLMPPGITVLLKTKHGKEYLCLVEDEGFTISPDKLVSLYGSGLSGEYTVIGIFSRKEEVSIEQIEKESGQPNIGRAMFVFQQAAAHLLKMTEWGLVLRPIVIYRDLVY
jgi:hypothetical protein